MHASICVDLAVPRDRAELTEALGVEKSFDPFTDRRTADLVLSRYRFGATELASQTPPLLDSSDLGLPTPGFFWLLSHTAILREAGKRGGVHEC